MIYSYVFTKYDVRKKYDGYTEMGRKTKENIEEKKSKVCNYFKIVNFRNSYSCRYLRIIRRPFDLSGGPLIFLEKKVCILDTFLRESCIYFYL